VSFEEHSKIIETAITATAGRCQVIAGTGANATAEAVHLTKLAKAAGADATLQVTPYYNKPTQEGLYRHFATVADKAELPVILYNVPGRTASNIQADTTLKLARDFENIVAVKEASGDMNQIMHIIKNRPEGFLVLSGDDALTLPMLSVGADGVISVVANAYPATMSGMVNAMVKSDDRFAALRYHYQMLDVINALFADGNPAGIKALLEVKGILKNNLRLPLVKAGAGVYDLLKELHETLNLA